MRLVKIDWEDSSTPSDDGWIKPEQVRDEPLMCHSIGRVIKTSKDLITLAAHYTEDDGDIHRACGWMSIPKSAIRKIENLYAPKKKPRRRR